MKEHYKTRTGLVFLLLLVLTACKTKDSAIVNFEGLYIIIDGLYHTVSSEETDSLNRLYIRLNEKLIALQSAGALTVSKQEEDQQVLKELDNYLRACNQFHAEIFSLEDQLKRIEEQAKQQQIDSAALVLQLNFQKESLDELAERIYSKRSYIFSVLQRFSL
jgi:hypothetical protein